VQSVKTNIHLDQIATNHHERQLVPSASLCAFFAAVILVRTVDPTLCPDYTLTVSAGDCRMNTVFLPLILKVMP